MAAEPAGPEVLPADAGLSSDAYKSRGNVHYAEGRLDEAAVCFRQAIAADAGNGPAHFNLALVLRDQEQFDAAVASFTEALRIDASMADAAHLAGSIRLQQGDTEAALMHFRAAIASDPSFEPAWEDLATLLLRTARLDQAKSLLVLAMDRFPASAEFRQFMGNAHMQEGAAAEAAERFRQAIALKPDMPHVLNNLGIAQQEAGDADGALRSFEQACSLAPDFADALNNLGVALLARHRYEDALKAHDAAVSAGDPSSHTHMNRGLALTALRRWDEALAAFHACLAQGGPSASVHNHIGMVQTYRGRHEEARASYLRALAIEPDFQHALGNLGTTLNLLNRKEEAIPVFERLVRVAPEHDNAIGFLLGARMHACDWAGRDDLMRLAEAAILAGRQAVVPFVLLGISDSPELQWRCSRAYQQAKFPAAQQPMWQGERYVHDRIRIAYLSADFHNHATAFLMAELFELHDRDRFETIAISFGPVKTGEMRERLERAFDRFIEVGENSDREIARLVRDLEVDIAVDLKGYTGDARAGIFTHRAAPVQVSYIGYPGTMAAEYIDYAIADHKVIAGGDELWYTEKLVFMPDTYQVNDAKRRIAAARPSRTSAGLPQDGFVFCCFNNNYKISPDVFDIWMRLLNRVPGSVVWLLQDTPLAALNLRREAARRGVDPERLVFAGRAPLDAHLARHALADLFLDTLPCNAHTTTSDALWAGLPVLTRRGRSFQARVASSLLQAAGLPELITDDAASYEALAFELATTPSRLKALRDKLAVNRDGCALFDADRFRRHLESAYTTMWQLSQAGESPKSFDVEPLL